ncbi:hypothetical protein A3Q56_03075 [Intoshia linei]|uniref:Uncharacterized protein n=1 Tax=Intoshia linei TaxID=1819745 RepID=A0A177B4G2_9BILA|nr:hypothetical protein A3Q56_03075 [Intoshia linei]
MKKEGVWKMRWNGEDLKMMVDTDASDSFVNGKLVTNCTKFSGESRQFSGAFGVQKELQEKCKMNVQYGVVIFSM